MKINRKFIMLFLAVVLVSVCIPVSQIFAVEISQSMTLSAYEENGQITVSGSVSGAKNEDNVSILVLKGTPKSAEDAYSDPSLISAVYECPISNESYKYSFGYDSETDIYTVYASYPDAELNASAVVSISGYSALFNDSVVLLCDTPVYNLYGEVIYTDKAPYIQNGKVYVSADVAKEVTGLAGTNDIDVSELGFSSVIISDNYAILTNRDSLSDNEIKILKDSIGVFVSKEGSDYADGTYSAPVATIEKAVTLASKLSSSMKNIHIFGGEYEFTNTLMLTKENAGVKFNAFDGENVVFSGGTKITDDKMAVVTDDEILSKFPKRVHGSLKSVDLSDVMTPWDYKIEAMPKDSFRVEYTVYQPNYEVYSNGKRMTNARFPNNGYEYLDGALAYNDSERLAGWENAVMFYYNTNGWAHYYANIASVSENAFTLGTGGTATTSEKTRFAVINAPSELDIPGEWCVLDGKLYYYPETDFSELYVGSLKANMINLTGADNIAFNGITFNYADKAFINSDANSDNLTVINCVLAHSANSAMELSGKNAVVDNCDMYDLGYRGVSFYGGNKLTLDGGNSAVENCNIYDYGVTRKTGSFAIGLNGVGNSAVNNKIFNAPHMAVWFMGNDHIIKGNDIHDVLSETSDAGAIYGGRSWTERGTVVSENYIHDCRSSYENAVVHAIYFDDGLSGNSAINNVIYNIDGTGAFFGGGRDNVFTGNTMVKCDDGTLYYDARWTSQSWVDAIEPPENGDGVIYSTLANFMSNSSFDREMWISKYPGIEILMHYIEGTEYNGAVPTVSDVAIPANAVIENNIKYSSGSYYTINSMVKNNAKTYEDISTNIFTNPLQDALAKISYGNTNEVAEEDVILLYPLNNSTVFSGTNKIYWSKVSGAESYVLTVSENIDLSGATVETTSDNYAIKDFTNKKTYYYKVEAFDKYGSLISESPIYSFNTSISIETSVFDGSTYHIFTSLKPQGDINAQLIYGLYTGNKLKDVTMKNEKISSGTEYYNHEKLNAEENDSYKFFLWEQGSMTPLK